MNGSTQKKSFLVIFRGGLHLQVRKISTLSVKLLLFFAKNILYFGSLTSKYYFLSKYLQFHNRTNQKKTIFEK